MSVERVNFLNEINSFVVESKSYLSNLLSKINWSEDKLLAGDNSDKLLRERGTSSDFHSDTPINDNIKEFNSEINKVYSGTVDVLPQPVKKDKEETLLEILARERDLKRRRIGYKGRIHTKHKSHHEILREVIAQQMEAIEDTISGDLSTCSSQIDDHINSTKEESVKMIDISQMNVNNPHLTWKYVANQLNLIKDEDKSEKYIKEKMSRSKSELHNDEDSKSDKSYHKHSKDKYYEGMYRSNVDMIRNREKKDISYIDSRNSSKEKLTNRSKSKTHHENLDGNHSNVYRRKSDKDSYPRRKQNISHYGDNRYTDKSEDKSFRNDYQEDYDKNSDDSYQNKSYKDYNLDKGLSNINRKEEYWESNEEDDSKIHSSKGKRNRDRCKKDGDKDDQDRNKRDRDRSKEDRYIGRRKKGKDHDTNKEDTSKEERRRRMYCDKAKEDYDRSNENRFIDCSKNKKDHDKSKEASDKSNEDYDKHNEETRKKKKEDRHLKKSKKRQRSRDKSCEISERSKKKKKKRSRSR